MSCSFVNCNVTKKNNPDNYTFHRIPFNCESREEWVRIINRPRWAPNKHSCVCSKHFEEKYFIQRTHRRVLRKDSIPTLNLYSDRREPSSSNANNSKNKKAQVKAVVSKKKQVTAAHNSQKPSRSNAKTSKSKQKNISTSAANNTEWSSSNLKLTKVLCVKCNEEVQPSEVATMLEGQVKSVIAKVYSFLEREVEYLMTKCAALDLTPLLDIRQRTAEATGFSESTVSQVLREEKLYQEQMEPAEKRLRLDLDHELDRVESDAATLVVKEEAEDEDEDMEREAAREMAIMMFTQPPYSGFNKQQAEASPTSVMVKVEPLDDDVNRTDTRAHAVTSNEHIKTERDDGVFYFPLTRGGMFANNNSTQLNHKGGETCMSDNIKIEPQDDEFYESGTLEDIAGSYVKTEITEEGFS